MFSCYKKNVMLLNVPSIIAKKKKEKITDVDFRKIYKIPIVFHIVYNKDEENIEKTQVLKQVESLNKDFRNKNLDNSLFSQYRREKKLSTDTRIEFFLAEKDPKGNRTEGITRKYTKRKSFKPFKDSGNIPLKKQPVKSSENNIGTDAWDTTKYLNVWICKLDQIGGYAQYPPDKHPSEDAFATDGIVVDYTCIGKGGTAKFPHDEGRTLTHEIGHWLGLYHLWGPDEGGCYGDDEMSDIPPQRGAQVDCPKGNGEYSKDQACEYGQPLVLNFMDYWNDCCKLMFTKCQAKAMRGCLTSSRKKLVKM